MTLVVVIKVVVVEVVVGHTGGGAQEGAMQLVSVGKQ